MIRTTYLANVTIQLPNPAFPMNYGLPVLATSVQVISSNGQQMGHPVQIQGPMIESDMTPELLATVNEQLATIGYKLVPANA